ncbi:alkaline protease [Myriangium duriaei CBS 260.36]|uniref:Alkaline protease n=1 Tax=Myriangium duriaei CBS 260.36 TaxID=1168546 RepID=A0A9P4IUQ9_9PEZI|nr:alkaline protease [Myriangium duriaei CBS 260.36]
MFSLELSAALVLLSVGSVTGQLHDDRLNLSGIKTPDDCSKYEIADRYIITLKPGVNMDYHLSEVQDIAIQEIFARKDGKKYDGLSYRYSIPGFQAYAGHFDKSVIQLLKHNKDVADIEPDEVWASTGNVGRCNYVTQANAPYGLSQISHRKPDSKGYTYHKSAGKGTYAYVIDSGIDIKHKEFESRASIGFNAFGPNASTSDIVGHGTHVAGIIGSKTFGVAKRCNLIAVKVLGYCPGWKSTMLSGIDWAVNDILDKKRKNKAVINFSLGGPRSMSTNRAVNAAFDAGVVFIAAAGNGGFNASLFSPGSAEGAITVGATRESRRRSAVSNYGQSVTLFAPGVRIISTWPTKSHEANKTKSGTSMAAPFVAGLALYLQGMHDLKDAKAVKTALLGLATKGIVDESKGSPNLFAYNGGVSCRMS